MDGRREKHETETGGEKGGVEKRVTNANSSLSEPSGK